MYLVWGWGKSSNLGDPGQKQELEAEVTAMVQANKPSAWPKSEADNIKCWQAMEEPELSSAAGERETSCQVFSVL